MQGSRSCGAAEYQTPNKSSPVKLSYRPSTITMLMLEDLVLMSSSAAYSGEPSYSFARSAESNTRIAIRLGVQSSSMTSIPPPHTTNRPP